MPKVQSTYYDDNETENDEEDDEEDDEETTGNHLLLLNVRKFKIFSLSLQLLTIAIH